MVKMKPVETIPALVARVKLETPEPRVNGGPPVPNNVTQADVDKLNQDKGVEYAIMNAPGGWGAQPSEKNRAGQVGGFAAINSDLTFTRISTSSFGGSNYMKSRRVG
jgi:hypothetical protein